MKYDELIKDLRICASTFTGPCEGCSHTEAGDCYNRLKRDAADAIEELQKLRWIPVAERLPEQNTRVIGFMAWKGITAIEYQHGKWYSTDHLQPLPNEAVTHWMPLPQAPKEE